MAPQLLPLLPLQPPPAPVISLFDPYSSSLNRDASPLLNSSEMLRARIERDVGWEKRWGEQSALSSRWNGTKVYTQGLL